MLKWQIAREEMVIHSNCKLLWLKVLNSVNVNVESL